jgi:hypothetical protein
LRLLHEQDTSGSKMHILNPNDTISQANKHTKVGMYFIANCEKWDLMARGTFSALSFGSCDEASHTPSKRSPQGDLTDQGHVRFHFMAHPAWEINTYFVPRFNVFSFMREKGKQKSSVQPP